VLSGNKNTAIGHFVCVQGIGRGHIVRDQGDEREGNNHDREGESLLVVWKQKGNTRRGSLSSWGRNTKQDATRREIPSSWCGNTNETRRGGECPPRRVKRQNNTRRGEEYSPRHVERQNETQTRRGNARLVVWKNKRETNEEGESLLVV